MSSVALSEKPNDPPPGRHRPRGMEFIRGRTRAGDEELVAEDSIVIDHAMQDEAANWKPAPQPGNYLRRSITFGVIDKDHSNAIDKQELVNYLVESRGLSEALAVRVASKLIFQVDENKDKQINGTEWRKGHYNENGILRALKLLDLPQAREFDDLIAEAQVCPRASIGF